MKHRKQHRRLPGGLVATVVHPETTAQWLTRHCIVGFTPEARTRFRCGPFNPDGCGRSQPLRPERVR